ncbi:MULTISPECIES: hypothetical protein [Streptacidiphilus]|uniref:DUF3349 domain-containing protein n=1 Tax=Streptacidiphilus cavernicola TaxID=3342716 RepID=A0ABV6UW51_9ACTN|nr:hypothetical protein [Streptacidiphilus jeojiense]
MRPTSAAPPAATTAGADDITHMSPPTLAVLVGWLKATSDEQLVEALLRARPSPDLNELMNTLTGRLEEGGLRDGAQ